MDPYRDLTLDSALDRAARRWPDKQFLRVDGRAASFAELDEQVGALAHGLRRHCGVGRGDHVAVFMRNSLECAQVWFATCRLGAVWVPVNTEFRGRGLQHALRLAGARLVVVDAELYPVLAEALDAAGIRPPVVTAGGPHPGGGTELGELYLDTPLRADGDITFSDTAGMLYTSGTTSGSKACLLSHRYFVSQATILARDLGLRHDDVLYCPFPLFHADATALTTVPALLLGATAALGRRFSASRFWDEVREQRATVFDFMGATLSILWKAEPRPDDADNPVRLAWGVPVPAWAGQFEERFGLRLRELYGSTEASLPITQRYEQPRVPGSCGQVTDEFDILVADDQDRPVPAGTTGELLIRPKEPFAAFSGYFRDPEATMRASRNLWFHSGDLARIDEAGNVFFVSRKNDVIRRRGENISAEEIEQAVLAHPAVVECAAIGVDSELTEEDLKIVAVVRDGHDLTAGELHRFCERTMARFQVPRYIELATALPHTPTGKVEKFRLKQQPLAGGTEDFESARARPSTPPGRPAVGTLATHRTGRKLRED